MIDCVVEIEILFKYFFFNNDFFFSKPKSIFYIKHIEFQARKEYLG